MEYIIPGVSCRFASFRSTFAPDKDVQDGILNFNVEVRLDCIWDTKQSLMDGFMMHYEHKYEKEDFDSFLIVVGPI